MFKRVKSSFFMPSYIVLTVLYIHRSRFFVKTTNTIKFVLKHIKMNFEDRPPINYADEKDWEAARMTDCCCCKTSVTCVRVFMWIAIAFTVVFIGVGSALLPIGLGKQKDANNLDPSTQFTVIEPGCNITQSKVV
jgi:hypothetical protein